MAERLNQLYQSVDRNLRSPDTVVAWFCRAISPKVGEEYLNSDAKRRLDLALAIPLAVVTAPAVVIACGIKYLEDGANPIFIQDRVDGDQKGFKVIKIRTMVPGAESIPIAPETKEQDDPRITWWGRFFRKHHIDEMPQFIQVIEGTLSLVGPRPRTELTNKHFKKHWSEERYNNSTKSYNKMKKGVTGLNQVFGNGKRENGSRYYAEQFYVKNASLGLDLYILLWKTVGRVLKG